VLAAAICISESASLFLAGKAMAQEIQSDQLGIMLGTTPRGASTRLRPGKGLEPIRDRMTLRAGQSVVVRAGASALTTVQQTAPLVFKLGRKPACGVIWETPQGVVLEAKAECAGQTLEFDYEVSVGGSGGRQSAVKVEVQALVQSGVESCGIANAPYDFVAIPGGLYSLKNPPPQLTDLVRLIGTTEAKVEPFCITEEAVPAAEMEAFLAEHPFVQKRKLFPEALDAVLHPAAQIESGRGLRSPALAVSHRMAQGYAQRQSDTLDHRLHLPQLEHYVAAALHLLRQQPDAPSTHSFFVSLRGGLIEWTDTPCDPATGTFVLLGTRPQTGVLDKYCYEASQRVARMGFRLVARKAAGEGGQ